MHPSRRMTGPFPWCVSVLFALLVPLTGEAREGSESGSAKTSKQGVEAASLKSGPRITVKPRRKGLKRKAGLRWVRIPRGSVDRNRMRGVDPEDLEAVARRKTQSRDLVRVPGFWMADAEVTVGQYRACFKAGACSEPNLTQDTCLWTVTPGPNEHRPMNCVYREQALEFSRWVGGTLPTEVQWFHAARGGKSYAYAGSNNAQSVAWYGLSETELPKPGALKLPNGYGLFDMSGNLMEWVAPEPHRHDEDILECGCEEHIFRGGAGHYPAEEVTVDAWNGVNADVSNPVIGFRPVMRRRPRK